VFLLGALIAGCTGGSTESEKPEPTPTATATPTPAVAPDPPRAGRCYDLSYAEGLAPTVNASSVPCATSHTSQTFRVAQLDSVLDGHLLAVDSERARAQAAQACPQALPAYLGATPATLRLSMIRAVWFGPTVAESDAGHNWYRCDAVVLAGKEKLQPTKQSLRGVLATQAGRSRYGLCSTGKPGSSSFSRVVCSAEHSWRAIGTRTVKSAKSDAWPGERAARAGESSCKSSARARAEDKLKFSWGYEWPTEEQWDQGIQHGTCWIPD
jgi:hypothetical protein